MDTVQAPQEVQTPRVSTRSLLIVVVVVLALMGLLPWSVWVRCEREGRAELARSTRALAAALLPAMLNRDRTQARDVVAKVASSGEYARVAIGLPDGSVYASSDRSIDSTKLSELQNPPAEAKVSKISGGERAVAAILYGSTVVGSVLVERVR